MKKMLLALVLLPNMVVGQFDLGLSESPTGSLWDELTQPLNTINQIESQMNTLEVELRLEAEKATLSQQKNEIAQAALNAKRQTVEGFVQQIAELPEETGETIRDLFTQNKTTAEAEIILLEAAASVAQVEQEQATQTAQEQKIAIEKRIISLQSEVTKQNALWWYNLRNVGLQALWYALLIGCVFALRYVVGRGVNRATEGMTYRRREAFRKGVRLLFNVIIGLAALAVLFTQIATFLPFLALLGTGLAFAVRNPVASLLAWFLIDKDYGYGVGDVIVIRGKEGRVKEITPLMTVLRERQDGAETGRIFSVPNKEMLDEGVTNASRMYGFIRQEVRFFMTVETDMNAAKILFEETLNQIIEPKLEALITQKESVRRAFKLEEKDLHPRVFVGYETQNSRGYVMLRARFFVPYKEMRQTVSDVHQAWFSAVAQAENVHLYQN